MLRMRDCLREALSEALARAGVDDTPAESHGTPQTSEPPHSADAAADISIERPRDRSHGDWSSNAALVLSKSMRQPPRQLAQKIAAELDRSRIPHLESVEIAGPGFLNFHLSASWLHEVLGDVIDEGSEGYAQHRVGAGQSVSVEFVSANPTGPLHAGHSRWAAYGDSLCRLLERCGYRVVREFYANDRGRQTELFGESLEARRSGEEPPEGGYLGDYVTEWAAEMPADADPREWGIRKSIQEQKKTLEEMNVAFDLWASESELVARGAMERSLADLGDRGAVYQTDGASWLRTSEFGDDADRVLVKSDGEPTYFLPDIAYHHEKFSRCDFVIDILGADHHGYVGRMRAAMAALGHDPDRYEVLIGQNVTLRRDGAEMRLSKRAGTMVSASELLHEVGSDVTRLTYLLQSIDTTQTIDIDVISANSVENPVYYLQYAHARIHSLYRVASERGIERIPLDAVDFSVLAEQRELDVLLALEALPDTVLAAMRSRAPHQLTNWARELAAVFHRFWHDCPILHAEVAEEVCQARLWLVEATRTGLEVSLGILGVSMPERL